MSVYKIYHINNNNIIEIICFVKSLLIEEKKNLNELISLYDKDSSDSIFSNIFSKAEIISNSKNDSKITFIDEQINFDDNIESIRKKL